MKRVFKKRQHISATGDGLESFYLKKKKNSYTIYKVHIHIIVCSTFRNLRSFD